MSRLDRLAVLVGAAVAMGATGPVAGGCWSGGAGLRGGGIGGAATVLSGPVPTAARSGAAGATIRWGTATLTNGALVRDYQVRRYEAGTGAAQTMGAGCSGRLTALICTESDVPAGNWRYTVTPLVADHWTGAESAESGILGIAEASLVLDRRLFGAPLPAQTTGTVSGLSPGEDIAYSYGPDRTSIPGAPTVVDASGGATITALTIPDIADGSHTVYVTGLTSGVVASTGIVTDTTPPTMSSALTPAANAAGWNRTPVEVTGAADDGGGSGVSVIRATSDGSDPRTSPTTLVNPAPGTVTETMTLKVYAIDLAGNESSILVLPLKIDMDPPTGVIDVVDITGGAVVQAVGVLEQPGLAYYRGVAAGSFRLTIAMSDTGGSGPGAVSTSSLIDAQSGFAHTPGVTATGDAGVYITNPFSWSAGTTSTPTGSATLTDVAGNTTTLAGALVDDSTGPAGVAIDAVGLGGTGARYASSLTVTAELDRGTDVQSGLAPGGATTLRASAPLGSGDGLANGVCAAYGAMTPFGDHDPGATVMDTVPTDRWCYRFAYAVTDKVGNVTTATTPDVKVQVTAPASLMPSVATIVPVSGLAAQYVAGTSVHYRSALGGSFTVSSSASDAFSGVANVAFPAMGGFAGGGVLTTPWTGTTFRSTYSWAGNGASASPGSQALTATDHAGRSQERSGAFLVSKDDTGPGHALSLAAGAVGAYLSGTSLYYRNTAAGTFKLVDALTDAGSGPVSATYPALAPPGWAHAAQTVTTPAGGPYVSSAFTFNPYPFQPGAYTVSALDRLGNTGSSTITFIADSGKPSGVSISYPTSASVLSVPITLVDGSDSASGVNASSGIIRRDQATLNTTTLQCGSFPGSFATTVTLTGGNDTSVSNARCYKYRYLVSDNGGNQATFTSPIVVKVRL